MATIIKLFAAIDLTSFLNEQECPKKSCLIHKRPSFYDPQTHFQRPSLITRFDQYKKSINVANKVLWIARNQSKSAAKTQWMVVGSSYIVIFFSTQSSIAA